MSYELEPVVVDGKRIGWRARDRAAWEATPARVERAPLDEETMSEEAILDALDLWTPGPAFRARLARAYKHEPVKVSRLTLAVLDTPGLRDPVAVLHYRLGELELPPEP